MSEFINTIDVLGEETVIDSIIDRSIVEFKDDQVINVGAGAFGGCKNLVSVDLPNCTSIKGNAFNGCESLSEFNFEPVTSINNDAFQNCFDGCDLYWSNNISLMYNAFQGCKMKTVYAPQQKNMPMNCFNSCPNLVEVELPQCERLDNNSLQNCKKLEYLDILGGSIHANFFYNMPNFKAFIIRQTDGVVTLTTTYSFFTNTPFESGQGYFYVPRALIEDYKAQTHFVEFSNQFRALEDYTLDGTVTGKIRKHTESITLNVTELTFTDANSYTLIPTGIFGVLDTMIWSSNDLLVARVNNGVVTPVSDGTAIITVTCGDYSASCVVTVNAGLEPNILAGIGFNTGYISNNGSVNTTSTSDTYTDKFGIDQCAGNGIIVTLNDVKSTASNSRICYYNENNGFISYTLGTAATNAVTITSTVPTNAVSAAISVNKSNGFSGITITYNGEQIGAINYTP